jgi:hypothetical protein
VNARLKPIESRCITRPDWDNTHVREAGRWVSDNHMALVGYYRELGKAMPDDERGDHLLQTARAQRFLSFCHCQWDLARERSLS